MNAEKIVRALKHCGEGCKCTDCPIATSDCIDFTACDAVHVEAADLIESLQAQLVEATQIALAVTSKYETSIKMHKITADLLEASQRREKATVEALCQLCRALDKKAGRLPLCDPDCKWRGPQEAGDEK